MVELDEERRVLLTLDDAGLETAIDLAPGQRRGRRAEGLIALYQERVGHHAELHLVEVIGRLDRLLRGHHDLALGEHGQKLQALLLVERREHLVDRLQFLEERGQLLLVLRQQVGHEEDLGFRDQRAGEARRLVDELQDARLRLLHDVGGFAQRAEGEELHGVVGVRLDLFLEFLGEDALDLVHRFLEGVAPGIGAGAGRGSESERARGKESAKFHDHVSQLMGRS